MNAPIGISVRNPFNSLYRARGGYTPGLFYAVMEEGSGVPVTDAAVICSLFKDTVISGVRASCLLPAVFCIA
jgi:hypothetical protein